MKSNFFPDDPEADLNGDGIVNAADLAFFKSNFFSPDPDADLNGDGIVNATDLVDAKTMYFSEFGTSGVLQ